MAAQSIDAAQPPVAVVTGFGPGLDAVCGALRASFGEIWKIADESLAYPNAELVRKALANALPRGVILLVPHSHFGVDLSPGLSIRMDAAFVPDVLAIEGVEGKHLKLVRQEFGGQVSTHVRCDITSGAVLNIRPGAFLALAGEAAGGQIREVPAGPLAAGRRYLSTVTAGEGETWGSHRNWPTLWARR
jgi:electron transfer flavoprotein alpha subunit